jgi:YihY family inner membrane protein
VGRRRLASLSAHGRWPYYDAMLKRLANLYVQAAQGRLEEANAPWARFLLEVTHVGHVLAQRAIRDRLPVRASMLAYWTTVAMVPLFLLAFALMRPLGLTEGTEGAVRGFLLRTIVAGSADELTTFVSQILVGADFKTMGILGVVGVMVFGFQLYSRMEQSYNDIFGARLRRGIVTRFIIFYSAVTLGPLLIALGFVASSGFAFGDNTFASTTIPVLFTATALVAGIRTLPCTRVSWRAALVGGFSSAVVFEAAKSLFNWYTTLFGTRDTMKVLYGSLGFLPVFLLWLYVLWFVVLIGVEIAYLLEHWKPLMDAQRRRAADPFEERRQPDGFFALGVMSAIAERFVAGEGPSTIESLSDKLRAYPQHIQTVCDVLADGNLLVETEDRAVVPARPPAMITGRDVIHCWRQLAVPSLRAEVAGAKLMDNGLGALDGVLGQALAGR